MFKFIKKLLGIYNTNMVDTDNQMTSNHFKVHYYNSPKALDYRCPINYCARGSWDVINISDNLESQRIIYNDYLLKENEYHAYVGQYDIIVRFYSSRRNEYVEMTWKPHLGISFFSFKCYDSGTRYDIHYSGNFLFKFKDMLLEMEDIIMNEYNERKKL